MCGICGMLSFSGRPLPAAACKPMTDSLAHRGPDDAGYFLAGQDAISLNDPLFAHLTPHLPTIDRHPDDTPLQVFLGHRRLAVLDPTPAGHQPMGLPERGLWITYNGEIYNFMELKQELTGLGHIFNTRTDTEVVLHAFDEWGPACVERFNGMFAFALWDAVNERCHLARDRYGIKPLYYTIAQQHLVFASEIKAILACPLYRRRINLEALNEYFTFQNLFQYETMFADIHLLPPANMATLDHEGFHRRSYWDYDFTTRAEHRSFAECRDETLHLFTRAVSRQLLADVPVGAYLSGGMDSGSITAVASRHIPRLTTFTAGFELSAVTGIEATFDERRDAELMAHACDTQHFEQVINAGDIRWVMPELVWHMEDLRVGMSYPNYYISRLASRFVKVCLSGAGGDELYGGYPWRYYRIVHALSREDFFRRYYAFWQRLVGDADKHLLFQDDVCRAVAQHDPFEIFRRVFTFNERLRYDSPEEHVANSLYFEIKTFLHGLLIVGDRLSMAHGLEERYPFLDNDLVDFAMAIPVAYKLKNLEEAKRIDENEVRRNLKYFAEHRDGKNVLRKAMEPLLPPAVTARRKQGFSAPDESWYRGENFAYVRDTLLGPDLHMETYIRRDFVERIIDEHARGANHRLLIWSLICFEEWCRRFKF